MEEKKKIIFLFLLMFAFSIKVCASTCSDARILELSSLANNVNVSYEKENRISDTYVAAETNETTNDTYPAFYVTIYKLTKDLNVSITRDDIKKTVYANAEDAYDDGVIYVDAGFATMVKTFTIKIRSNDSNCQNEVLKTVVVTTPMYNIHSQYEVCKENPDFDLCQEFTTVDYSEVTDTSFSAKLDEYKEQKAKEEKRANSIFYKIASFISKYRWIFITIAVLVIAYVIYFFIKRKKSRLV